MGSTEAANPRCQRAMSFMRKSDFFYELPAHLIAAAPLPERKSSRLLCLDGGSGRIEDRRFGELPELLAPGDLLVLNDTRVIPARLFGRKLSGGRVEILVERVLGAHSVLAHVRAGKAPKPGAEIVLEGGLAGRVTARREDLFELEFMGDVTVDQVLDAIGHLPLPPYIDRPERAEDW